MLNCLAFYSTLGPLLRLLTQADLALRALLVNHPPFGEVPFHSNLFFLISFKRGTWEWWGPGDVCGFIAPNSVGSAGPRLCSRCCGLAAASGSAIPSRLALCAVGTWGAVWPDAMESLLLHFVISLKILICCLDSDTKKPCGCFSFRGKQTHEACD